MTWINQKSPKKRHYSTNYTEFRETLWSQFYIKVDEIIKFWDFKIVIKNVWSYLDYKFFVFVFWNPSRILNNASFQPKRFSINIAEFYSTEFLSESFAGIKY